MTARVSSSGNNFLGITEPISLEPPGQREIKTNAELERTLRECSLFEGMEESRKREEVLGKLNVIVKEWAKQVSIKKGLPEHMAAETGAKIFTFGSYRLGVHISGADIDTLCLGPQHIDRTDFFTGLSEVLRQQKEVTDVTCVPDAYVPVMNIEFSGILIDLLFARLNLSIIPDDLDILDSNILKNVDEKSILSLNGCRVTDQILKLVPNIANFRMTLRCMKYWAQRRGIYSNVVGFLGGVSWGILTARICQLYPNALPGTLVMKFFQFYCKWNWPNPILLTHLHDAKLGHIIWNPHIYPKDKLHLMPIITPAYPSMNSTYNVSASTLKIMKEEFVRGADVTIKIEKNMCAWNALFDKSSFFTKYRVYLQVDIMGHTEAEHRKWEGLVESKLRLLIQKLEFTQGMMHSHPYPKVFPNPQPGTEFPCCSSFFMGLTFNLTKEAGKSVDLTPAVGEFQMQVRKWPDRTAGMDVRVHYLRKDALPEFVKSANAIPIMTSPDVPVIKKRELPTSNGEESGDTQAKKLKPTITPASSPPPASPPLTTQPPSTSPSIPPQSLPVANNALSHLSLSGQVEGTNSPVDADVLMSTSTAIDSPSPSPALVPIPITSKPPAAPPSVAAKPPPTASPSSLAKPPAKPSATPLSSPSPTAKPSATPSITPPRLNAKPPAISTIPPKSAPLPVVGLSPSGAPVPIFSPPSRSSTPPTSPTQILPIPAFNGSNALLTDQTNGPNFPGPNSISGLDPTPSASMTPNPSPNHKLSTDAEVTVTEHDLGELEIVGQTNGNKTTIGGALRPLSTGKKGFISVNLLKS